MKYWINITKDCNLHCRYCYQLGHHEPRHMSIEIANQVIDFIRYENKPDGVNFFGGEAMLNFEVMKYLTIELKELGVKHFATTSNLTLLTDDKIDFLNQYNFRIMASIDGTKHSHNMGRITRDQQGTFELVMKNFEKLRKKEKLTVVIAKTLTKENLRHLYEDYLFLKQFKLPVHFNYNMDGTVISSGNQELFAKVYEQMYRDYIPMVETGQFSNLTGFYHDYQRLRTGVKFAQERRTECVTPCSYELVFDYKGHLSPCHNFVELDMLQTSIPISCRPHLREDLAKSNSGFAPLSREEILRFVAKRMSIFKCNDCKYRYGCIEEMLYKYENSCVYHSYTIRSLTYDRDWICAKRTVYGILDGLLGY